MTKPGLRPILLLLLLVACTGQPEPPEPAASEKSVSFQGDPPPLDLGRLAGHQILIQYEGAARLQPQVIRSKSDARELAKELVERLRAGEDFEALAREYSDDGTTARKGGDMGAFKPRDHIRKISNALAKMHYGEVRGPLPSRFGFHIVRRDPIEFFGARQILIQHVDSRSAADGIERSPQEARELAEELLERLEEGEDFGSLARDYSDAPEAGDGGRMEPFARGEMVAPFEDAVLGLNPGERTGVFESPYGFHIAERLE